ncbi:MAG: hypothetical protein WA948_13700 [Pontixanthobacter sp.]
MTEMLKRLEATVTAYKKDGCYSFVWAGDAWVPDSDKEKCGFDFRRINGAVQMKVTLLDETGDGLHFARPVRDGMRVCLWKDRKQDKDRWKDMGSYGKPFSESGVWPIEGDSDQAAPKKYKFRDENDDGEHFAFICVFQTSKGALVLEDDPRIMNRGDDLHDA